MIHEPLQSVPVCAHIILVDMVLLKGNIAHAHNFIATNECVSSAKESSATGYKYIHIDRFICKWVFFMNQAYIYRFYEAIKILSSVRLKSQFECEMSKVYHSFATLPLSSTV